MVLESAEETVKITAMVFAILLGATAFSMVFTYSGGDALVEEWLLHLPGEKWGFLILSMLVIMLLGFFIDLRGNFFHYRPHPSTCCRSTGNQHDMVRDSDCDESADFFFDPAVWL